MIESAGFALHQDITFLIKKDMAEHQIMQSMMRHVAREFANADMISASLLTAAPHRSGVELLAGAEVTIATIEAMVNTHQLNYPMVLRRALDRFGLKQFRQSHKRQTEASFVNRHAEQHRANADEPSVDEAAISDEDIAVFTAVDQMLPKLQDEGLCAGVQLGLYRAPSSMRSLWGNRLIVVLIPIDGKLGRRDAVFTYLLRRGFEPVAIQGRMSLQAGSIIHPLPCQELTCSDQPELVLSSSLKIENTAILGKSFLMGLITELPPVRHWLDLDHRDLD